MVLTAVFVVIALAFVAVSLRRPSEPESTPGLGPVPDMPVAFGYRTTWIAIRTREPGEVLDALGLEDCRAAGWQAGIGAVYDDHADGRTVFVTPPTAGWVLVVGMGLPQPVGRRFADHCTPLLLDLGSRFLEVQYFFTCPELEFYAWARVADGRLTRAFAWGDDGIIWNKGRITREESTLGLQHLETAGGGEALLESLPSEDHVIALAGRWSLDPTTLGELDAAPGLGVLGRAPARWRQTVTQRPHDLDHVARRPANANGPDATPPTPSAPRPRPSLRPVG